MTSEPYQRLSRELWPSGDLILTEETPTFPQAHREYGLTTRRGALAVLPMENQRAAANAMIRWTDADGPADVALRSLAWCAARAGLLRFMIGDRVAIRATSTTDGEPTLHEYLAEAVGAGSVELSCAFGSARPNQKPVVRIHSVDGSTLGFAKIGWNEVTRALIENEAAFLQGCEGIRTTTFRVPRLIYRGTWNGRSVAVTTPLMGKPSLRGHEDPSIAVIEEIASLGDVRVAPLAESPYRVGMEPRLGRMRVAAASSARAAIQEIDRRWSDLRLGFGRWHGDWTPWNMTTRSSRPIVWDWERTAPSVPAGFDLLHYAFHRRLAAGRSEPWRCLVEAVESVVPSMQAVDVDETRLDATVCLYVLEMHMRFGEDVIEERSEPSWIRDLLPLTLQRYAPDR